MLVLEVRSEYKLRKQSRAERRKYSAMKESGCYALMVSAYRSQGLQWTTALFDDNLAAEEMTKRVTLPALPALSGVDRAPYPSLMYLPEVEVVDEKETVAFWTKSGPVLEKKKRDRGPRRPGEPRKVGVKYRQPLVQKETLVTENPIWAPYDPEDKAREAFRKHSYIRVPDVVVPLEALLFSSRFTDWTGYVGNAKRVLLARDALSLTVDWCSGNMEVFKAWLVVNRVAKTIEASMTLRDALHTPK
jgi:hypothetical protein